MLKFSVYFLYPSDYANSFQLIFLLGVIRPKIRLYIALIWVNKLKFSVYCPAQGGLFQPNTPFKVKHLSHRKSCAIAIGQSRLMHRLNLSPQPLQLLNYCRSFCSLSDNKINHILQRASALVHVPLPCSTVPLLHRFLRDRINFVPFPKFFKCWTHEL